MIRVSNLELETIKDIELNLRFLPANSKLDKRLEEIIESYDDSLKDEDKITILCSSNSKNLFNWYFHKNFDLFQNYFRNLLKETVFISSRNISDTDCLYELQWDLDSRYPGKNYKLKIQDFTDPMLEFIYDHFYDEVKFFDENHQITKYDRTILYETPFSILLKYFIKEMGQNDNKKNILALLNILEKKYRYDEINISVLSLSKEYNEVLKENIGKILDEISKKLNENTIQKERIISFYNKLLHNITLLDWKNTESKMKKAISFPFISSLQQLRKIPPKERKNNVLYLKTFQVFLKDFLSKYEDKIESQEMKRLEAIFQRMIQEENIAGVMSIHNNKSLCHYYKTNELVFNIPYPMDLLEKYNAKQYLELEKIYGEKTQKSICGNYEIIYLMEYLGYSLTKQVIQEFPTKTNIIFEKLQNKSKDYIQKISNLLLEALRLDGKQKEYGFEFFWPCFDLFYNQGYQKITLPKIIKAMDSISYILFPNNYHISENLSKLNFVAKGSPLIEKTEAIKLYNDYRFRILSSIPDVSGEINQCHFEMVDLHSPEILSNGIGKYLLPNNVTSSSCLTPNGKASSCLKHGAINPNGRFFKVTYQDKILTYSWVWRCGEVLCFDNIEATEDLFHISDYENTIYSCYQEASSMIMNITNQKEKNGVKLVIVGRNEIDIKNTKIDQLPKVNDYTMKLFQPNHSEELYLKDSSKTQLILAGQYHPQLLTEDVDPIYLYLRKEIQSFKDCDTSFVIKRINSIYFDYCLKNNQKYEPIKMNYLDGYLNEDWYVGLKSDGQYDFYYCGMDSRLFEEAEHFIGKRTFLEQKKCTIVSPKKEQIEKILNLDNIQFDLSQIKNYLDSFDKEVFSFSNNDYTHTTNLRAFSEIFQSGAITSSKYGHRFDYGNNNGENFISIAKVNSTAYYHYVNRSPSFLLSKNICAFPTRTNWIELLDPFVDSSYPFRPGMEGEYQVYESISLNHAKGILIPNKDIISLIQMVYFEDLFDIQIPLILLDDKKITNNKAIVDNKEIKKYTKIK